MALAGLSALFLSLPILVLVARAIFGRILARALTAQSSFSALALSLATTAISLSSRWRSAAAGLCPGQAPVPWSWTGRSHRRPAAGAAAGSGRAGFATVARQARLPRRTAGCYWDRDPVHDPRGDPGPDVCLGAILHPFRAHRDRERRARPRGRRRVDGASDIEVFRHITVPLAGSALAAGLVMSWARSLGEFGATIMFAGNIEGRTQTLPLVVYGDSRAATWTAR